MAAVSDERESAPSASAPEASTSGKPAVLIVGGLGITILRPYLEVDQHH